ncbi:MAG: hypothetical protein Q9223_002787 [Gallowayella weberi]
MSAPPGPRGLRGSRPSARTRGAVSSRVSRSGQEDHAARKARLTSNLTNGVLQRSSHPSSRNDTTRDSSRKVPPRGPSLHRAQSRRTPNTSRHVTQHSKDDGLRDATIQEQTVYKKYMENTFSTLGEKRKQERKNAIRDGLLADPDKPTTLANAITIIGKCQEMCAEFERVQRVVQFMVDDCEKVPHSQETIRVPSEDRMVKRYRRPAAGYEEQLPSDIRPPLVLQKTLDYLMDEVVGGSEPLANVHKFVWDRTRAIRNDFSIQQVTKVEDLRIAISCFERIARFHILSLHQLAGTSETSVDFDAYQEREQLNNTLLSLIYYYDDSRHRFVSPNEPEFRAYCIIFEIQDQRPDLEDRAQNWPAAILKDQRVKTAMKLYATAASASDLQGPLRPPAPNAIAQANVPLFFNLIQSPAVPYLMACVAEIYFNKVRRTALDTIWKAYKVKRGGNAIIEDWTLSDMTENLGFDDEDQAQIFCEEHGFTVSERDNREAYVDLGSVAGRYLSDSNPSRKQPFSTLLVEQKRRGRTLPAVINGLTAAQAQAQGLVVEDYSDNEGSSVANEETLFLPNNAGPINPAKEPRANGIEPSKAKTPDKTSDEETKPTPFQFKSSAPSFIPSGKPKEDTSGFFGKPTPPVSFQSMSPSPGPPINVPAPASSNPFNDVEKLNPIPGPFSSLNKPESISDSTKPISQAGPSPTPMASLPGSVFDLNPPTSDPPKVSFGTSPLFNYSANSRLGQTDKKDAMFTFVPAPKPESAQPALHDNKLSDTPFSFPKSSTPVAPSSALFPQGPALNAQRDTIQKNLPPAFAPFLPPTTPSSEPFNPSIKISDRPAASPSIDFTKPTTSTPKPFFSFQTNDKSDDAAKPSNQTEARSTPVTTSPTFQAPQLPTSQSAAAVSAVQNSKSAVAPPQPDPRPAVLNALAESLITDDQGLLQQFIEFTVAPIVHQAYHEVEDERSWKRAREVRTILLSKKYLGRWKDNAWRKKLLRKGKERRSAFAESMQQMARSTRQRPNHTPPSFQSSLLDNGQNRSRLRDEGLNMAPPPAPQPSILKRKSLPTDSEIKELPIPDTTLSNKRRRQEPPPETKSSKQSLRSSLRPHHQRSRTMGDSRRPGPQLENLADFSHMDENTYDSERILQQARRLIGHAKLDTTRGDYFALKARGADPNVSLLPQPGIKRSRVDEQIERARKLLKPSSPTPMDPTLGSQQPLSQSNGVSSQAVRGDANHSISTTSLAADSPDNLLAQVRKVREALAEGAAWYQAEREKADQISSSRSSELPQIAQSLAQSHSQSQSQSLDDRSQGWRSSLSRAQVRLEKTKANGLLPPEWDWNRSVTEWKLRGGVGSPRPGASREQSGTSTPAVEQQQQQQQKKKPIGLAAMTNGLSHRPVKAVDQDDEVYNDDEEGPEEHENRMEDGGEDDDEEYPEDHEEDYDEEGIGDDDMEDEEEEEEDEDEEEDDYSPERTVLHTQGNSADTAIDLD